MPGSLPCSHQGGPKVLALLSDPRKPEPASCAQASSPLNLLVSIHLLFATHRVLPGPPWWPPSGTGPLLPLGLPVLLPAVHRPSLLPSLLSAAPWGSSGQAEQTCSLTSLGTCRHGLSISPTSLYGMPAKCGALEPQGWMRPVPACEGSLVSWRRGGLFCGALSLLKKACHPGAGTSRISPGDGRGKVVQEKSASKVPSQPALPGGQISAFSAKSALALCSILS